MALLAIVALFIVLGLSAFFLAMASGSRGAKERRERERRKGVVGATIAFIAALIVLGVLIPVSIFASDKDKSTYPDKGLRDMTELQRHGQELFGQQCRRCHTLAASDAVATVGPNLDQLRPPKALVLDAIENGRARGNGQMAADLFAGQEAEDVANFVAKAVGQTETGGGEGGSGGGEGGSGGEEGGGSG